MAMTPIRVLFMQRPAGGGSAASLCHTVTRLDRRRIHPVVALPAESRLTGRLHESGVETVPLEVPGWNPGLGEDERGGFFLSRRRRTARVVSQLAEVMDRQSADVVHHNNNPVANRNSIMAARSLGLPQVCHVRFFARYHQTIDRKLAQSVDEFVFISRAVEEHARSSLKLSDSKGVVLDNGFDVHRIDPDEARRVRADLGLSADTRAIAVLGRLVPWKGQDVLMRAAATVTRRFPEVRFLVVGDANHSPASQAYANELRELARDLALEDHVDFTGFRSDPEAVMAASDVVVHTSVRPEPFGRVVVEAMSVGTPVIATAAGGVTEVVEHGRTGLLVPPGDADALARALVELLEDPARAASMAREAREYSATRFGNEATIRMLEDIYARIAGRQETASDRACR